jgi:hypothetical protein
MYEGEFFKTQLLADSQDDTPCAQMELIVITWPDPHIPD